MAHDFVSFDDGGDKVLEIITPTNYGSSYNGEKIALTLLKTATYCAHPVPNRPLLRSGMFISKVDQGQRDFAFRLDVSDKRDLKRKADEFAEKPYALNVFPTVDEKSDNGFKMSIDNPRISFVTLKEARQTKGYVLRLFNCGENPEKATISFGNEKLAVNFGKYEVKTVIYDNDKLYESKEAII